MQLTQLHYFCTVARCNSMSHAAEELWISQSALSKAITSLEDELGVKLFDRVGRSIRLNEAGRIYYHQVSHILFLLSDATKQLRDLRSITSNEVRVVFTAANFICSWMREAFIEKYPEYSLRAYSCYAVSNYDLVENDFYIYASPTVCEELESKLLLEEELMLAFSKDHPLAKEDEVDMADTADYVFQCLPSQENLHENLLSLCQHYGFEPNIGLCTEDSFTYFNGLISSDLIALIPKYTAFPALTEELAIRPIKGGASVRSIYLGYRRDRTLSDAALAFKDFCIDTFRNFKDSPPPTQTAGLPT